MGYIDIPVINVPAGKFARSAVTRPNFSFLRFQCDATCRKSNWRLRLFPQRLEVEVRQKSRQISTPLAPADSLSKSTWQIE